MRLRLGVVLALGPILAGCDGRASGPRDLDSDVDEVVVEMAAALQEKRAADLLSHVSYDYAGDGGLGFADVQSIVETFTLSDEPVGARVESVEIAERDGARRARVKAQVAFVAGATIDPDGPVPVGAVRYRFDIWFQKVGKRWQARGGSYERI